MRSAVISCVIVRHSQAISILINLALDNIEVNRYICPVTRTGDPDLRLLQAIADPARLAILRQLSAEGATCACDLTGCCGVGQSTVSHHLKVLREAGWVDAERRGTWIWYSLRRDAVERFRRIASGLGVAAPSPAAPLGTIPPGQPATDRRMLPVLDADWRQW
jgi:ArsR family transcriptional regulator